MKWKAFCAVDDLEDGDMRSFCHQPKIAIYRVGDEFLATGAICTHMESDLTEGYLDDDVVECALHAATFNVRDGRALSLPATEPLTTYPVRVEGGMVEVGFEND
ncbi:non-heme iron oxygenase ferredoxin subunit [Maritimibacter sp. UBA3975]|uniref:non-heme iron oxygenase ferredoxin subunit n=1 Tax=Maritimibacter sp. UBA3975 TaxID=1946833 RepID=UPI0025BAE46D|nr:non-heme iron oxygenase ferredoxin subunit [Maritimibacter sp. UBA3975]